MPADPAFRLAFLYVAYGDFEDWLSAARMAPFLRLAGQDQERALALYRWHTSLSKECFAAVHNFEVLLRNTVDRGLSMLDEGDGLGGSWIMNTDVVPVRGRRPLGDAVRRCEAAGGPVTKDRIIARLPLSFWVHLFGRSDLSETLWRRHLCAVIPGAPHRKDSLVRLENLRNLRNRVAHHDSLLSVDVAARQAEMLDVARWIDPKAEAWLRDESRVGEVLAGRP